MPPQHIPTKPPSLRGLTDAEKKDALEKWNADRKLKERIARDEYLEEMTRQAMRNELRMNEAQWRIIEPKYKRQIQLMLNTWMRATHRVTTEKDLWIKPTEDKLGRALPLTFAELTEAYRNVDKLVDLLRR
ncbi:MAG: hypothetical protein MUP02_03940, partial [Actinobacteria bacterium]|nr:hypothetical protein [Actinomycetota bacterium]